MTDGLPALTWQAFTAPKAGGSRAEFEDAVAADAASGRFAVADGASESAFAATWADLLVEDYLKKPQRWVTWLPLVRQRWQELCHKTELPWYLEEKIAEGAYAAFLAVAFQNQTQWQAKAIGDCCLFHVRDNRVLRAFPLERSQDFGSRPTLLCSRFHAEHQPAKCLRLRSDWREHDCLIMATDALALWFLLQVEAGKMPWTTCLRLENQQQFVDWLKQMRDAKKIRNDDTTLLVINSADMEGQEP
ncbi:MAG TPA: hypothetical protein VE988_16700 [Gemmataceae bacterium]|nr:hypothetical protein [Gemmataceae bacterium]